MHQEDTAQHSRRSPALLEERLRSETTQDAPLARWSPERIERFVAASRLLRREHFFLNRPLLDVTAVSISDRSNDVEREIFRVQSLASRWRKRTGFIHRLFSGLNNEEAMVVVSRLSEATDEPYLDRVLEVVDEIRTFGLAHELRRPTLAAQLLTIEPSAKKRAAWMERVRAAWRLLRRWGGFSTPRSAQALLFWALRDESSDPAAIAEEVDRIQRQLRSRKVAKRGDAIFAAIILSIAASNSAEEAELIHRIAALSARTRREKQLKRSPWFDATPMLALLAVLDLDGDYSVGLLLSLQRELELQKVKPDPILTFYLLIDQIRDRRPELRDWISAIADVLVREVVARQTAATVAVMAGAGRG